MFDLRKTLEPLIEPKYKDFTSTLIPGHDNILGIRLPHLRKIAKELAKGDWKKIVYEGSEGSMEELMVKGMIIGHVKIPYEELKEAMDFYVPKLNNWSVTDSFVVSLKRTKYVKDDMFEYIKQCLEQKEVYVVRFGLVMLLNYYVEEQYLDYIFTIIETIDCEPYYVMMAAAWLIATCFTKEKEKTTEYLKVSILDSVTYNKALQKITESLKVSKEDKLWIRSLKR